MNASRYITGLILIAVIQSAFSCKQPPAAAEATAGAATVRTPVTVTTVADSTLSEYIELNATSAFLQKNYVKANANGYLQSNFMRPGQFVKRGQLLFTIQTKESQSIGNAVNKLDSSFRFSGTNAIKAGDQGFITQLNHQAGDYVQDGEQLAIVSDISSFVFLLDLPYELKPYLENKKTVDLLLPDGEKLKGTITGSLPSVDPAAQTQSIVIKVNAGHPIPENLIAKVRIIKRFKANAVSVPKAAVLTDETQTNFWVMKLIDSSTAVRVPVTKGIETTDRVEILTPVFTTRDQILLTGHYGLPDTALVKIVE